MNRLVCSAIAAVTLAATMVTAPPATASPPARAVASPCNSQANVILKTRGLDRLRMPLPNGRVGRLGKAGIRQLAAELRGGFTSAQLCDDTAAPDVRTQLNDILALAREGNVDEAVVALGDLIDAIDPTDTTSAASLPPRRTTRSGAWTGVACPGVNASQQLVTPQSARDALAAFNVALEMEAIIGDAINIDELEAKAIETAATAVGRFIENGAGDAQSTADWLAAAAAGQAVSLDSDWKALGFDADPVAAAMDEARRAASDAVNKYRQSKCKTSKRGALCLARAVATLAMFDSELDTMALVRESVDNLEAGRGKRQSEDCVVEKYSLTVNWKDAFAESSGSTEEIKFELFDSEFTLVNRPRLATATSLVTSCGGEGVPTEYGTWSGKVFDIVNLRRSASLSNGLLLLLWTDPMEAFYGVSWTTNSPLGCLGGTMSDEDIQKEVDLLKPMDPLLIYGSPPLPRRKDTRLTDDYGVTYALTYLGSDYS